jgi:hypothetical protein
VKSRLAIHELAIGALTILVSTQLDGWAFPVVAIAGLGWMIMGLAGPWR